MRIGEEGEKRILTGFTERGSIIVQQTRIIFTKSIKITCMFINRQKKNN